MLNKNFKIIADDIKSNIIKTQLEIYSSANEKLINLYYNIGKILDENSEWGNKFIENIHIEIKSTFPNLKGFSVRNLKYMKSFYNEYKNDFEFVQLVAQIPWKHNITLIQKIKNKNIRIWYIKKNIEENWSHSILNYQIDTNLYNRQEKYKKNNNFSLTMNKNSD